MSTNPSSPSFSAGICRLSQSAIIAVTGTDAASFLHSQLTNDIKSLAAHQACLAGYCTPKGRLLTDMLVWKSNASEQEIFLEVPAELQESIQKRLQMFILRSQVKLNHLSASHAILGILGESAANQLTEWFPRLPTAPYELIHSETGVLIRLADADKMARYQWIMSSHLFEQVWPTLSAKLPILSEPIWSSSEIHAGIPHITAATQEKFVPQMLNYELIGGVNFKKGCYPGQEIVARTHYLGKQKRRTVLAQINHPAVQSGMEVFTQEDATQPCGMVVNAQPNNQGGSDCLIEIKTVYLEGALVQLNSGEICHWLPMPYPLPSEI